MKKRQIFFVLFLLPFWVNAQGILRQADRAYESHQYFLALQLYQKASVSKNISKTDKARDVFQQAECYRMTNDWNNAKQFYERARKLGYPDDRTWLYQAQAEQMNGDYADALNNFNEYKKRVPSDPAAGVGIESCNLALQWTNSPNRWKVVNETQINSKANDFCPTWSDKKHSSLVISSNRAGQTGSKVDPVSGKLYTDLFEAKLGKNGQWSTMAAVDGDVNLPTSNDGASCISKNGNHIYFTRCDQKKKKMVTCKIFYAEKQGTTWGEPVLIDFGLDAATLDSFNFRHPAVSVNEDVMVFSSDMSGTTGGEHSDLWVSTFDKKTKTWSKPVNMGPQINTSNREGFPYLSEDGTLYFSSDGHAGVGGLDIYRAARISNTSWGAPENMQSPINSPADDFGIVFDGKKQSGYLTSNRKGTKGADDIWRFYYEIFSPPLIGEVKDCSGEIPVKNALVELVGNDGSTVRTFTDANGHYEFKLKENVNYVLNVLGDSAKSSAAQMYFSLPDREKGKLSTFGLTENKTYNYDFCLPPVIPGDIRFPAVLYDVRKATLRPESKDSLNALYQILVDNPNFVIELDAHTDCRGSSEDNRALSQARAQACVDYLVNEKGIAKERLIAKGMGEDRPLKLPTGEVLTEKYINSKKTAAEKEALHQLNRRTVFRVVRSNYVDPKAPARGPVAPVNVKKGYYDESGDEIPETDEAPKSDQPGTPKQVPAPQQ